MQRTLASFGVTKKAKVGDDASSAKSVATEEKPRQEAESVAVAEAPVAQVDSALFGLIRDEGWRRVLAPETSKPYFPALEKAVLAEYASKTVFPPRDMLFAALNVTPLEAVRVVVLGQDPYHGKGQAMGKKESLQKKKKKNKTKQNKLIYLVR